MNEFDKLMAIQCDIKAFAIHTPMEARILRNIPYALSGYKFSSEDLSDLYAQDGDWYKPDTSEMMEPRPEYKGCIEKLQARETQIRKLLKIDPEIEKVLTHDPKIFMSFRSAARPESIYRNTSAGKKTHHSLEWRFTDRASTSCGGDGSPGQANDCSGGAIMCERPEGSTSWRDFQCEVIWAG